MFAAILSSQTAPKKAFVRTPSCRLGNCRFLLRSLQQGLGTRDFSAQGSKDNQENGPSSSSSSFPKPVFYVPRHERANRNLFVMDTMDGGETRLQRNNRLCPTRELYFGHGQWGRHKSPYRKFRHMRQLLRSAPLQRLAFPDLFVVTCVASGLTYYNEFVAPAMDQLTALTISPSAFAGATTAISLLAGFRVSNSYGRYREGRQIWSDTQTSIRDLARQVQMFVPGGDGHAVRLLRLCQAFPVALMFHLSDKGAHHDMKRWSTLGDKQFQDRVFAEFRAELYDVYYYSASSSIKDGDNKKDREDPPPYDCSNSATITSTILRNDFERICQKKLDRDSVPLEALICMSETISELQQKAMVDPILICELDDKVQKLVKALGGGERLLKTPLPTGFTRHSSRLLFLWSNSLPFALYPVMGPLGTLPTSLLTSYAVLGIEDTSVQLEEPFDILPLRQFSNTMYDSVKAIEQSYRSPRDSLDS